MAAKPKGRREAVQFADRLNELFDAAEQANKPATWLGAIEQRATAILNQHGLLDLPATWTAPNGRDYPRAQFWFQEQLKPYPVESDLARVPEKYRKQARLARDILVELSVLRGFAQSGNTEQVERLSIELGANFERLRFLPLESAIVGSLKRPADMTKRRKEKAAIRKAKVEEQALAIHKPGMLRKILVKRIEAATGIKPRTIEKYLPRNRLPK